MKNIASKTVEPGYATRLSDQYALPSQAFETNMSVARFQSWIDYAAANKVWVIVTFHEVNDPSSLGVNGEEGGISPAVFGQMMSYVARKRAAAVNPILVKTVKDVIPMLSNPVIPVAPPITNTAPTITWNGSSMVTLAHGTSFIDPGATAYDAEQGNLTYQIIITGTVNTAVPGTYARVYSINDASGSGAQVIRTVIIN